MPAIKELKRFLKRVFRRSPALTSAGLRLVGLYHRARLEGTWLRDNLTRTGRMNDISPENVVWIFCTQRSGSTWLRSMMEDLVECKVWEEPKVGQLFGEFYEGARRGQLASINFVMGDSTRKAWRRALRNFVLDTARAAHPTITSQHYLIAKEPDGAVGAPLLMEALPESRMILLIRDPRDVVASTLDAMKKGGFRYERRNWYATERTLPADERPKFVTKQADNYLRHISNAKKAYDAHGGRKVLIRYEDLKTDRLETMRRLCSALQIPTDEEKLTRVVEKHAWENIPEKDKGEGKFYRKATLGGWRKDLTSDQVKAIESITAPLLQEFYP